MNISELIDELKVALEENGDIPVLISQDDEGNSITQYSDYSVWYARPESSSEDKTKHLVLFRGWGDYSVSSEPDDEEDF